MFLLRKHVYLIDIWPLKKKNFTMNILLFMTFTNTVYLACPCQNLQILSNVVESFCHMEIKKKKGCVDICLFDLIRSPV